MGQTRMCVTRVIRRNECHIVSFLHPWKNHIMVEKIIVNVKCDMRPD